jgi:group I intron endonuclease
MKQCGIYEIKCVKSDKVLIGSSNHITRRFSQHIHRLNKNNHNNPHLQSAWNLYGKESFVLNILETCLASELLQKEDFWMGYKQSLNKDYGYNFKGAERPTHNKETCRKISEQKKGSKNPMYGKKFSENHKKKISIGVKNADIDRSVSEETRKKMSISQTGKKLSEETKRKIGAASKTRVLPEGSLKNLMKLWQKGEKALCGVKNNPKKQKQKEEQQG